MAAGAESLAALLARAKLSRHAATLEVAMGYATVRRALPGRLSGLSVSHYWQTVKLYGAFVY